jgi:hypothetical protein
VTGGVLKVQVPKPHTTQSVHLLQEVGLTFIHMFFVLLWSGLTRFVALISRNIMRSMQRSIGFNLSKTQVRFEEILYEAGDY